MKLKELIAELELEQGLKAHLLGNFYPRHNVRLVDVAVKSIKIYNEHKWDILAGDCTPLNTELPLVEGIQFRGKNTITPSECIEVLKLYSWLEECSDQEDELLEEEE
jgi:hypothetical protein